MYFVWHGKWSSTARKNLLMLIHFEPKRRYFSL